MRYLTTDNDFVCYCKTPNGKQVQVNFFAGELRTWQEVITEFRYHKLFAVDCIPNVHYVNVSSHKVYWLFGARRCEKADIQYTCTLTQNDIRELIQACKERR